MALPKEYYDILKTTNVSGVPNFPGITPSNREDIVREQYPGLFFETEDPREYGSFSDLMKSAGSGFVSGLTWSAVDLMDKDWEKMSTMERTGWIIGEGGALFTPVLGPFHILGKGGQVLTRKLGNKFIDDVAKQAGQINIEQTNNLLNGVHKVAKKTGLKYETVVRGLDKDIQNTLKNSIKNNDGVNWINQLSIGGDEADRAFDMLKKHSIDSLQIAFKRNGIDNVLPADLNSISETFVQGIAQGKYVNDIAEWVERGLGTRLPEFASKYLGMAAQDMALMGIHGLGVGAISKHLRGEEFDATESLSHSAIMSLAFPLIRRIPWGGDATLSQGVKAYWNSYKNVNYPILAAKYGDDTVRSMLSIMSKGSIKNLRNSSSLQRNWKAPGRREEYTFDDINSLLFHPDKAKRMPMGDVFSILEQMKGAVGQELRANWGSRYLTDLAASVPRMALGVIAMNATVFQSGAFRHMDGEELGSHILMSALMTKGRGAWGRDTQRTFLADLSPFYEGLKVLGVEPKVLQDKIRIYEGEDFARFTGASFATDPVGRAIENTFDTILKDSNYDSKLSKITRDFDPDTHRPVRQASEIYNSIKMMKDPDTFERLNVRSLNKETLDGLLSSIEKIQVSKDRTIKDVGWDNTQIKLTTGPAERMVEVFGGMLNSIGTAHGIPVTFNPQAKGRKITGQIIENAKEDGMITYNTILQRLERLGKAEIVERGNVEPVREANLTGGKAEEISQNISRIVERTYESLDAEYGGKRMYVDPRNNQYLDFIGRSTSIESTDFLYKVVTGEGGVEESNLASSMDKLFAVTDAADGTTSKYRNKISDYKIEKATDKDRTGAQAIEDLTPLFRAMQISRNIASNPPDRKTSSEIKISDLVNTAGVFKERFNRLPRFMQENFYEKALGEFAARSMGTSRVDKRAIYTLQTGMDEGILFFDQGSKKIQLMSSESIDATFPNASAKDKKMAKENLDMIAKALGPNIQRPTIQYISTTDPKFINVGLDSIAKVAKATGNRHMKILFDEGLRITEKIQHQDNPLQRKLKEIKTSLENAVDINTNELRLEHVKAIERSVDDLLKFKIPKEIHSELEAYSSRLKQLTQLGQDKVEQYNSDLGRTTESIEETLMQIIGQEVNFKKEPQRIVSKLINMAIRGKNGGGLERTQAMELTESLNSQLNQLMGRTKETNIVDTIKDYNEQGGSWRDASKVIEQINRQLVGKVLSNSHDPVFRDKALDLWEKSYEKRQLHHDQRTLQNIIQDYNLYEPGDKSQINKAFLEAAVDISNPNSIRNAMDEVKSTIFNTHKRKKAEKEWIRFIEKDSNILISALLNGRLRNTAEIKSGLVVFNPEGKFRNNPNDDFFDRINITGDNKNAYDIHYLSDSMSILKGKERTFSVDNYYNGDPVQIQNAINKGTRVSSLQPEVRERIIESQNITNRDLIDLTNIPLSPLVYMRLSPGTRILFETNQNNIDKLNLDYNNWYNKKIEHIKQRFENPDSALQRMEEIFGHLRKKGADTDNGMRLKMLAMHIDYTKTGQFNKWISEISKDTINFNSIARIESNLYKRGFLSDGGTTQRFHPKLLDWNAQYHTDPVVRAFSRELRDELGNKYTVGLLADEAFTRTFNKDGSPFDNRRVVSEKLQADKENLQIKTGDVIDRLIDKQVLEVENNVYKSLQSSILDGAKIVDERLGRLLWAQKGGMGEWNGAKTVLFSTGENSMLGKGFAVYIPEVSTQMLAMNRGKGVHMIIGESSAKSWDGLNLLTGSTNRLIQPFNMQLNQNKGAIGREGWIRKMSDNMGRNNLMQLDISDIGVQFTSKNTKGVHISSSMFDWQKPDVVNKGIKWMDIEGIVKERKHIKSMIGDSNDLIHRIFESREQQGQVFTEGSNGVIREIVDMGVSSNNPLVRGQLNKFLRNEDYKMLSKIPNRFGEDNFLVSDVKGDLSIPVFAEIVSKRQVNARGDEEWGLDRRLPIQFGGIGISAHTASIKYGATNILDKPFVFRDPTNGVDWIVEWSRLAGKKDPGYNYFSPFAQKWNPKEHRLSNDRENRQSSFIEVENTKFNKKITPSDQFKQNTELVLNELQGLIRQHNLDFGQAHRLLKGQEVYAEDGGGRKLIRLKSIDNKKLTDLMATIGASLNAIPKVNKDQPVMRVDAVDGNVMNGTMRVNAYDLRTTLQRDFDGDHIYTYFEMPFEMVREFSRDMGHKPDYEMFDKTITQKDINIFGLDRTQETLRAGDLPIDVGFSKYAHHVSSSRQAIGQVISSRKAMSWLENSQFSYRDIDGSYKPLIRGFSDKKALYENDMEVLNRLLDTSQNALDLFGGTNRVMMKDAVENYYFFGDIPPDYIKNMPKESLEALHSRSSVFTDSSFGKGPTGEMQKEMFKIILRTLAKANRISNDLYDEAGSRAPETWELQKDHRELTSFFTNPDNFLLGKLARQIGWMSKSSDVALREKAKILRQQMVTEFFSDALKADPIVNYNSIKNIYADIQQGRLPDKVSEKYKFQYGKPDEIFNIHVGGKILNELISTKVYHTQDPMGNLAVEKHLKAGFMVRDLLDQVAMARAFGEEPSLISDQFILKDVVKEVPETSYAAKMQNQITKGHIRNILQKEYREANNSLRFFNEEKFVNPLKLEGLSQRVRQVSDAIKVIDEQIAKDMVVDRKTNLIYSGKNKKFQKNKWNYDVFVYELKGKVRPRDAGKNILSNLESVDTGTTLNYGNLTPYRWLRKDDKGFRMHPRHTYIIDKNPMAREGAGTTEARYAEAWKQVTGVGKINSTELFPDQVLSEQFRYDTMNLRNFIASSYSDAVGTVKQNRVGAGLIHKHKSKMETIAIGEYVKRWVNADMSGDFTPTERVGLILKYLLQPQIMTGKYVSDRNTELPYYKTGKRLQMQTFNWALENGYRPLVKDMIQKTEKHFRGEKYTEDFGLEGYKNMYKDGYNWSVFGNNADFLKSLMEPGIFTSPFHIELERGFNLKPTDYSDMKVIRNPDGSKVIVKEKVPNMYKKDKGCNY